MAQRVSIDLVKNPEVADVVTDLNVGDGVKLTTTIVSKDDQTLVLEVEEAEEGDAMPSPDEEAPEEETEEYPEAPADDGVAEVLKTPASAPEEV